MTNRKKNTKAGSGSPGTGEPDYLVVGSLRRTHGVRGELVMEVLTDFPERLKEGTQVYVGASHAAMLIEAARTHAEGLIIRLSGLATPEQAARYRNQLVYVPAADRPALPEGQYYEHQLIGAAVVDDGSQQIIGTLSEVLHTGANDVYVVTRPSGSEVLLPVISSVVLQQDVANRTIRVHMLPGLIVIGKAEE